MTETSRAYGRDMMEGIAEFAQKRGDWKLRSVAADSNHEAIGLIAAEFFISRGFKDIAFCGIDGLHFSDRRGQAFLRTAKDKGAVRRRTCTRDLGRLASTPRFSSPNGLTRFLTWRTSRPGCSGFR